MSLYVEIKVNETLIDYIAITNITAKKDSTKSIRTAINKTDICLYRVIVNHGQELFTIKHRWEDGARVLVRKVLAKMKKQREGRE